MLVHPLKEPTTVREFSTQIVEIVGVELGRYNLLQLVIRDEGNFRRAYLVLIIKCPFNAVEGLLAFDTQPYHED